MPNPNRLNIKSGSSTAAGSGERKSPRAKLPPKQPTLTPKQWKKKIYTPDQIKGLLQGYVLVSHSMWSDIPVGAHVRYFKKDGAFVRGGFVTSHWFNKEGKPFIHLANSFKKKVKGYATWPLAHESADRIYKKIDRGSGIEMDVVRGKTTEIIGQINKLVDIVKQQKVKLDAHDEDIRQLKMRLGGPR